MSHAHHLRYIFNSKIRKDTISKTRKALAGIKFDAIAVQGVSGLLAGSILAHEMNKELCIVRKDDGSHSMETVESPDKEISTYVIVDDCIDSGATVANMITKMGDNLPAATCVGMVMYNRLIDGREQAVFSADEVKEFMRSGPGSYFNRTKPLTSIAT